MRVGLVALGLALAWASSQARADAAAGRARAAVACAVCHGAQGLSLQPHVPHLAGQPEIYLVEQLRNYRSGRRQHEVMSVIARTLSDQDIEDLAQWYASLQIRVE